MAISLLSDLVMYGKDKSAVEEIPEFRDSAFSSRYFKTQNI
jgi:hypothetical protein